MVNSDWCEYSATMLIRRFASGDSVEPFRVVGILDFDNENVGRTVMGVPILGTIDMFEEILQQLAGRGRRPQKVVLTRTISGQRMRELQTLADKAQISLVRPPRLVDFEKITEDGRIDDLLACQTQTATVFESAKHKRLAWPTTKSPAGTAGTGTSP